MLKTVNGSQMMVAECLTIHTPGDFPRLLVAPANWSEVSLVVQEATVEEWLNVGILGLDVDLSARSWVLEILEHCNVVARREERMVGVSCIAIKLSIILKSIVDLTSRNDRSEPIDTVE